MWGRCGGDRGERQGRDRGDVGERAVEDLMKQEMGWPPGDMTAG